MKGLISPGTMPLVAMALIEIAVNIVCKEQNVDSKNFRAKAKVN